MKIFECEAGRIYLSGLLKERSELIGDWVNIDIGPEKELKRIIRFEIKRNIEFSLDLDFSEWHKNYETQFNGELVVNLSRGGIVKFDKIWNTGDTLELVLKMWD